MPVISLKPEEDKPKEQPHGLVLGVAAIVGAMRVVGILRGGFYYYRQFEIKNVAANQEEIVRINGELEKYDDVRSKNEVLAKQIENITSLLDNHICWSPFFAELEDLTVKELYFTRFSGDETAESLNLTGRAADYTTIGEQFAVFGNSDTFKSFRISQAQYITEGNDNYVDFSATLDFSTDVLLCENEDEEKLKKNN